MASAILQTAQYRDLADQCDHRAALTQIGAEQAFYHQQAAIFRKLAIVKERRETAQLLDKQDNGCGVSG